MRMRNACNQLKIRDSRNAESGRADGIQAQLDLFCESATARSKAKRRFSVFGSRIFRSRIGIDHPITYLAPADAAAIHRRSSAGR